MKEDKENYIPKFKLGQKVKYVGDGFILEMSRKKKNVFSIDEIINYNDTVGYYPQLLPIKLCYIEDKGECYYLIDGKWQVPESDLEAVRKSLNKDTLGARLRNLLSPYKNFIAMQKNGVKCTELMIRDYERNLQDLIDFSHSNKMEDNFVE